MRHGFRHVRILLGRPPRLYFLLDRNRGLKVVVLRTLPGVPLNERPRPAGAVAAPAVASVADAAPASAAVSAAANAGGAGIYKYGVELILQGSYHDLTAYLDQIERLPAQMFWSRAVLDAVAYPRITLTLSVFTLGLEAAWLSV